MALSSGPIFGAPGGIRTHDLLLRRQTLYPLSYRGFRRCASLSGESLWIEIDSGAAGRGQDP